MNDARVEINALKAEITSLCDELIKYRRKLDDLLMNLDLENMPAVSSLIENYRAESAEAAAEIRAEAEKALSKISLIVKEGESGDVVSGEVIVEAINGATGVSVKADKIDLNGAVSANENFKINTDGEVECKAITITGGEIHIPANIDDTSPVLTVYDVDKHSTVSVYADRIEFFAESDGVSEFYTVSFADNRHAVWESKRTYGDAGHYLHYYSEMSSTASRINVGEYDENGEEVSDSAANGYAEITPYLISNSYIAEHPVTAAEAASMKPLYIDKLGRIYASEV